MFSPTQDFYTILCKAHGTLWKTVVESKELEDREKGCNMPLVGQDTVTPTSNSKQLWIPTQNMQKNRPVNSQDGWRKGSGDHTPH